VRFEVFMAVTMKNAVFWDVTQCGSYKNQGLGGMYCQYCQDHQCFFTICFFSSLPDDEGDTFL
jgi:hypothetical protein